MSLLTLTQDTGSKCVPLDSAIVSVSRILTPRAGQKGGLGFVCKSPSGL